MAYPTGTLTFLFTDIEGSTQLWEQYPEAMKTALAKHDSILKEAVETNNGHVIKSTGDGIHAVFESAGQGVAATLAAQQALSKHTWEEITPQALRVRMGLHTGRVKSIDLQTLNELFLQTQPAHLQKLQGERLNGEQRSVARAAMIRSRLSTN